MRVSRIYICDSVICYVKVPYRIALMFPLSTVINNKTGNSFYINLRAYIVGVGELYYYLLSYVRLGKVKLSLY